MHRQIRARWLALATALVVLALVALFAGLRNRDVAPVPAAAPAGPSTPAPGAALDRAAALDAFERLGCGNCHRFEGRGQGGALDGIGARHNLATIRARALAEPSARAELPSGVVPLKARAAADPGAEAVVALLAQSK